MAENHRTNPASRAVRRLVGIGGQAAAITLRPLSGVAEIAADAGMQLERRAVDRVLDSAELERVVLATLDSARVQDAVKRLVASDGVKAIIAAVFDSDLVDEIVDHVLTSPAVWRLVDEIADSPAVTAAVTQQSLGFADQIGDQVRTRSRGADDWLERAAHRIIRRRTAAIPATAETPQPEIP